MDREGDGYLQQVCAYLGTEPYSQENSVGRMFTVDTGIMGRAFDAQKIFRTRYYETLDKLYEDLDQDLIDVKSNLKRHEVPLSYAAIPFFGSASNVILVLYAECDVFNFFADKDNNNKLNLMVQMCQGFCRLFDWLSIDQPFPTLRNFPFEVGKLRYETPTVFKRLQEPVDIPPPKFSSLMSFNYHAAVA